MNLNTTIASLPYNSFVSFEDFNDFKAAYAETVEMLANAMKRITQLENALFKHDEEGEIIKDAEDEPVISLEVVETPQIEDREIFEPDTKIEKAAVEFISFASKRPVIDGFKAVTPSILHHFRKNVLTEELRPKTKNPRQWKRELTEIVSDLVPQLKKDSKGNNRGIRLLFPRNFDINMTKRKISVSYLHV
jgi:hypothetical protein